MLSNEYQKPIVGSGPAFVTSHDGKYKEGTSYTTDQGRYKNAINVNKHTKEEL